jgi:hypothetical protein
LADGGGYGKPWEGQTEPGGRPLDETTLRKARDGSTDVGFAGAALREERARELFESRTLSAMGETEQNTEEIDFEVHEREPTFSTEHAST